MAGDPQRWDNLMDEAHERLRAIDAEFAAMRERSKTGNLDSDVDKTPLLARERDEINQEIQRMLSSEHAPVGYLEHYNQKYMTPPQPDAAKAEPEGPGLLKKFFTGVGDTFDYAVKNPISALKHIDQGKNELISAPFRAIESLVTNKRFVRGGMDRQKQEVAEYDKSRGIDSRSTGPVVAETLGQMAVPLPMPRAMAPTGNIVGDFIKGAGYSGGLHAIERKANDETVFDEGLLTSMAAGGTLSTLLGRFAKPRTSDAGSTGSSGSERGGVPPSTSPNGAGWDAPPNAAGHRETAGKPLPRLIGGPREAMDPSRGVEYNPAMEMHDPRAGPPAPIKPKPSPFASMMDTIKAKTSSGEPLTPREKGFALWWKQNRGTPPSNAAGVREDVNVQTRPVQAAAAPVSTSPPATPVQQLLRQEPPKMAAPVAAPVQSGAPAAPSVVEKPTQTPPQSTVQPLTPQQIKSIPPNKIIDVAKQIDSEAEKAGQEALLRDVISGKKSAKDIKVKPKKGEAPIAAVEGEVGATPMVPAKAPHSAQAGKPQGVDSPPPSPAAQNASERKLALAKPPIKNVRLEDHIKDMGYKLEEKEPFPGEKSYNIKDPVTGDTIARGDREQLVNALNAKNEGKGFRLYSGVDPTPFYEKIKEKLRGVPEGVEVKNSPHREKILNMVTREAGLSTPQFAMRGNKAGDAVTKGAIDFEDLKLKRVNDLFHKLQADGTYKDTQALEYFTGSAADRQKANDALVVLDKMGADFSHEELVRNGLTDTQARMVRGVRDALDTAAGWLKEIGADVDRLKGYIPRVWNGELELFVDGKKYVPTKADRTLGSSFSTLHEAAPTMWKLKKENPSAKIEARFFTDPDYLGHRGIRDAKEVGNIKAKLDKMGSLTKEEMDALFHPSKSYKDFARHLLERGDAEGYETEGLERVLYSYFHQAAKAVEGRKFRDAVEKVMKDEGTNLSEAQFKWLDGYVDRVLGKPTWDQIKLNALIRQTSIGKYIDPVQAGGAIKTARNWITYKSLGFGNVSWALVNLDSLSRHVWPMLQRDAKGLGGTFGSEKYLSLGVKEFFNNKALRQKLAHNNVIDIQQMSEIHPTVKAHIGKWTAEDAIMVLGKQTEEFVRGVAAIARYRMALDHGLPDDQAMRVASHFVSETVGRYSKAGKPQAFTGNVGGSIGMFKTYPIVMLQNMLSAFQSKDTGVIVRYMLASLGAGGIIGAIPGSEEVDKLATSYTGVSPIQWGYKHLGEGTMTGIASLGPEPFDVDLSRKAGLPDVFPNQTKDWLGPVWNTYGQTLADVLNGEHGEAIKDLVPTSLKNALAVSTKPGVVVGRYDKPLVELRPGAAARWMRGAGFQSPAEVKALRDYEYLNTLKDSNESELRQLTRRIYKGSATADDKHRFQELGGTNRRLKAEHRRETLTLRQRQEHALPRLLRGQSAEP